MDGQERVAVFFRQMGNNVLHPVDKNGKSWPGKRHVAYLGEVIFKRLAII